MAKFVSRIPSEVLEQCGDWSLPDITSSHAISAVKYQSKRQMELKRKATHPADTKASEDRKETRVPFESGSVNNSAEKVVESIEDVDLDDVTPEPMTAEKLNKITEDAHKEGFDKGYEEGFAISKEEGRAQGLKDAEVEVKEKIQQLEQLIQSLQNPLEKEYDTLQKQLLDIVCHLTRSVTERDLHIDSSIIEKVIKHSLELLTPEPKKIVIRLHKNDKPQVEMLLSEQDLPIHYEIDPDIIPGGCRIDTPNSHLDLSINTRLDEVLDNFLQQRYSQSPQNIDEHIHSDIFDESPEQSPEENQTVDYQEDQSEKNPLENKENHELDNTISRDEDKKS